MAESKKKNKDTGIDNQIKKLAPFAMWLGVLVIVFIVFYLAFQGLGKVKHEGLTFTKERYGEIMFYHYYYLTEISEGTLRKIDVFIRGNPAENNVPIEGEVIYPENRVVFLSINSTGLTECEYNSIAVASFSMFVSNNGLAIKAGTPDMEEATNNNQSYVTCGKYPRNMVVSLRAGNESKIYKTSEFCYNLEVSNCEMLPVMEKFIVQSMIDAKESDN